MGRSDLIPPREFFTEKHLGSCARGVFPKVLDDLVEFWETGRRIALLDGGLGWGKTTWIKLSTLRAVYEAIHVNEPQKKNGKTADSTLTIAYVSSFEPHTASMLETVLKAPVFANRGFRRSENRHDTIELTNGFEFVALESRDTKDCLGKFVMVLALDDLAKEDLQVACGVSYQVKKRFWERPGHLAWRHGIPEFTAEERETYERVLTELGVTSDLWDESYPLGRIFACDYHGELMAHLRSDDRLDVFERLYATWDTNPERFSPGRLRITVGPDARFKPRILRADETPPDDARIVEFPEEFLKDFEADPRAALRDFAGIPNRRRP